MRPPPAARPVGLFGSQIQAIRAPVRRTAAATASRSMRRPGDGTVSTVAPATREACAYMP